MKFKSAFTLIELLIVISIVGFLSMAFFDFFATQNKLSKNINQSENLNQKLTEVGNYIEFENWKTNDETSLKFSFGRENLILENEDTNEEIFNENLLKDLNSFEIESTLEVRFFSNLNCEIIAENNQADIINPLGRNFQIVLDEENCYLEMNKL